MKSLEPEELTFFDVDGSGTLSLVNYSRPVKRYDYYESVNDWWAESPDSSLEAMRQCQPLSWAIYEIYSEQRESLVDEISELEADDATPDSVISVLHEKLKAMPENPDEGVPAWLENMGTKEFKKRIVPEIQNWFDSAPDWLNESEYLSAFSAVSAAFDFFQYLENDVLEKVGIVIVEGEHPGSSYYAAELTIECDEANQIAKGLGLSFRFTKQGVDIDR